MDAFTHEYGHFIHRHDDIKWTNRGTKISSEEYKEIMEYARSKGIELSGFKQYDGAVQTIKELVDDADSVASIYPTIKTGKKRLTIGLDESMRDSDFDITRGHIISINANAFRDTGLLEEEYKKLVAEGWFVKGSDYHAIIKHEIGHVMVNLHKVDGLEIMKNITGINSTAELMVCLEENLSKYAGEFEDGSEIISECFASVFGSKQKNDLALRFIEVCDNIYFKGR